MVAPLAAGAGILAANIIRTVAVHSLVRILGSNAVRLVGQRILTNSIGKLTTRVGSKVAVDNIINFNNFAKAIRLSKMGGINVSKGITKKSLKSLMRMGFDMPSFNTTTSNIEKIGDLLIVLGNRLKNQQSPPPEPEKERTTIFSPKLVSRAITKGPLLRR